MTQLTDEQRFKEGPVLMTGTGGKPYIPHLKFHRYDLLIPTERIAYQEVLLFHLEHAHYKTRRIELIEELRWLLETDFSTNSTA